MEVFREAFRILLRHLTGDSLWKAILVLLLFSLVPLAEIFLFIYIGTLIGNYLVLMAAVIVGLVGGVLALRQAQDAAAKVKKKIRRKEPLGRELADLAGVIAGCVLLITPGFITDLIGFLLFLPSLREALGRALVKRLKRSGYSLNSL